ncbi:MAG: ImuA family protein [Phycisphaerales bacterium]
MRLSVALTAARLTDLRSTMVRASSSVVPTGLGALDRALPGGGLGGGLVHEWIGVQDNAGEPSQQPAVARRTPWSPALTLLMEMAWRAAGSSRNGDGRLVWIGPGVWPYPVSLVRDGHAGQRTSLDRHLFVRASRPADRVWAIDLALRSRTAAAVIADGSGFDLAATRRLQLAGEAGDGLCLLARPPWERAELSAAATRWVVSCMPSSSMNRRWTVELLRCKGVQPASHTPRVWVLEQDRATRALRVAADVLDRPGEAEAGGTGVRRTG